MLVSIKTFLYKKLIQISMGVFGKLRFWKKHDDEEDEQQPGYGAEDEGEDVKTQVPPWSKGYEERYPQRQERFERFGGEWQPQQPQQQFQQSSGSHEVIIAKLDSLNQRLANLERYAADDEREKNSSRARW